MEGCSQVLCICYAIPHTGLEHLKRLVPEDFWHQSTRDAIKQPPDVTCLWISWGHKLGEPLLPFLLKLIFHPLGSYISRLWPCNCVQSSLLEPWLQENHLSLNFQMPHLFLLCFQIFVSQIEELYMNSSISVFLCNCFQSLEEHVSSPFLLLLNFKN